MGGRGRRFFIFVAREGNRRRRRRRPYKASVVDMRRASGYFVENFVQPFTSASSPQARDRMVREKGLRQFEWDDYQ